VQEPGAVLASASACVRPRVGEKLVRGDAEVAREAGGGDADSVWRRPNRGDGARADEFVRRGAAQSKEDRSFGHGERDALHVPSVTKTERRMRQVHGCCVNRQSHS